MFEGFTVGYSISFETHGTERKLRDLAQQSRTLSGLFDRVTASATLAGEALSKLDLKAATASAGISRLDEMLNATAKSGEAAGVGAAAAASGYTAAGNAATYAAASVSRYNAIMAASFGASAGYRSLGAYRGAAAFPATFAGRNFERALPNTIAPLALAGGGGAGGGRGYSTTSPLFPGGGRGPLFARFIGGGGGDGDYIPPGGGGGGFGGGWGRGGGAGGAAGGAMSSAYGGRAFGLMARAAMYGGGAALGLGVDAFHEAAKLQQILVSIQNVTGTNAQQIATARALAFDVGSMTNMSVVQTGSMLREIVRQSQGAMPFGSMLSLLPEVAKMQVVLGTTRGMRPEETTDTVMSLVHLFRQYNPKKMPGEMDTILRMLELSSAPPSQVVRQMTYFEPVLKNLHVSDNDASALMVAMSRFGMAKGKGGTSLQDLALQALGPLQMTQHLQKGKAALLGAGTRNIPGLDVLDAHGKSRFFTDKGGNIFGFLDKLAEYEKKHGSVMAQRVFTGAFGVQGSRIASVLADPTMIDQLHKIEQAVKDQKSLGLDEQFRTIRGTAGQAERHAFQNFQSLMTEVGDYALPGFTKGLNDLGDAFHQAQHWMHDHRELGLKVQHDITEAVKGTEQWFTSREGDWVRLRDDALGAWSALKDVGKALGTVADAALILEHAIPTPGHLEDLRGWLKGNTPSWMWDHSAEEAERDNPRKPGEKVVDWLRRTQSGVPSLTDPMMWNPFEGKGTLHQGAYQWPFPATAPTGNNKVTHDGKIVVEVHGGDNVGAVIAGPVADFLRGALAGGDPRVSGSRSGAIVTSPLQPSILSTPHK